MRRNGKRSGSAVVEVALMMPWLAFIFVGLLDFGFYSYASICTQSAARVAAIGTSGSAGSVNFATACTLALGELLGLPNMTGVTTCATSKGGIVTSTCPGSQAQCLPAAVVVALLSCTTTPKAADCTAQPIVSPTSSQVTVTYQSISMIPIPGAMMGRMTLSRTAEVRISQ